MNLAVVAQSASMGGGSRFIRPLLKSLLDTNADLTMTVLVNPSADWLIESPGLADTGRVKFEALDSRICELRPNPRGVVRRAVHTARELSSRVRGVPAFESACFALQSTLSSFDVVYLSWPYFLPPLDIESPVVATFHDFNFCHRFGSLSDSLVESLEVVVPEWIKRTSICVTSAEFIHDELMKFYGPLVRDSRVVHLSTFATTRPTFRIIEETIERRGLPSHYIACPSNTSPHKNLGKLIEAYKRVRSAGGPPLVLFGWGTQLLADPDALGRGVASSAAVVNLLHAFSESGLVLWEDVYPLGFVSDCEADALIAGADLCVAPSLYEAGSGPSLDAWALGTPVVMSDIAPFREHVSFLGVDAELFDPTLPDSIATSILNVVGDPERSQDMARVSQDAMSRYPWEAVARGYLEAFSAARPQRAPHNSGGHSRNTKGS